MALLKRSLWGVATVLLLLFFRLLPAAPILAGEVPQRIIALGPMHTKIVYLLGAGDRLVANTEFCRWPPEARRKEKIGTVLEIDVEHIFSLRPDLVLATGLTQPQQVAGLRRLGLRVEQFREPCSFAEIREQFAAIAIMLGSERRAAEILALVDARLQAVGSAVAGRARPKVLLQIGAQPLFIATGSSFTHDFVELAGGRNVAAGVVSGRYSEEMVMAARPDLIIVAMMGSQEGIAVREQQRWKKLYAAAGRDAPRVVLLDADLICSPTPETFIEGLSLVAGLIHPDLAERDLLTVRK